MFNLDKLNEDRPEWVCSTAWHGRQILDSTVSMGDSMVHGSNRDGMRFELGSSSSGPRFQRSQDVGQGQSKALHVTDLLVTKA